MFWLGSMFHRNYLTDGPDPTWSGFRLRDRSHAQEPWMGEYDPVLTVHWYCVAILCSIFGTCRFVCFHLLPSTQCSDDLTRRY